MESRLLARRATAVVSALAVTGVLAAGCKNSENGNPSPDTGVPTQSKITKEDYARDALRTLASTAVEAQKVNPEAWKPTYHAGSNTAVSYEFRNNDGRSRASTQFLVDWAMVPTVGDRMPTADDLRQLDASYVQSVDVTVKIDEGSHRIGSLVNYSLTPDSDSVKGMVNCYADTNPIYALTDPAEGDELPVSLKEAGNIAVQADEIQAQILNGVIPRDIHDNSPDICWP